MKDNHQYYLKIIALIILLVLGAYLLSAILQPKGKEDFVTAKGKDLYQLLLIKWLQLFY